MSESKKRRTSEKRTSGKKIKTPIFRIIIIILVLCAGVFAIATIPGLWKDGEGVKTDIVTVELKGDTIIVNRDKEYTLEELGEYFDSLKEKGEMPGMALVCDSANPPSESFYNQVIELMSKYGIIPDSQHSEKVKLPEASSDEAVATFDEFV